MKRLLLTGADGFTGNHLSELAKRKGYEVFPLVANLTDRAAVYSEVVGVAPTHVCHLAAISAVTHLDEAEFYSVNLFGTLNLLGALASLSVFPKKVLLVSSANVYGNVDANYITEGVCPSPVNHYAMSKLAMEHMAKNFLDCLQIIIARPFNYTGVGHDSRFIIPKIVDHFLRRAVEIELGNLDVEREYNDVRMVCDAYLKLLEFGQSGAIYNVCSGRTFNLKDVLRLLNKITGHTPSVRTNPALVRANEINRLAGSSAKLEAVVGGLQHFELEDTLTWMLAGQVHQ